MNRYQVEWSSKGKIFSKIIEAETKEEAHKIVENTYRYISIIYTTYTKELPKKVKCTQLSLDI